MATIWSKNIELFIDGRSQKEILSDLKDLKINRQLIYRTIKRYKDTDSVLDRPRSGRPTSVSTPQLKKKISSRIARNRRRSIRKMARDFSVSHESVRKIVRNYSSFLKRHTVHHLTPALRQKRFQRSRKLLARLAVGAENNILFSDEKIFTVEESHNSQNDRILAPSSKSISDEEKFVDRVQKPKYLMVWAGVSANCQTNLIFVPQGVKIDSKTYKELILESEIKHAGTKLFKNEDWIFQQDSAPAHASKATQS